MPKFKLGDLVRCKRCKSTYEVTLCGNCDNHHPTFVDLPPAMVVDHAEEMCSQCATPEEVYVRTLHRHERHHGALPN